MGWLPQRAHIAERLAFLWTATPVWGAATMGAFLSKEIPIRAKLIDFKGRDYAEKMTGGGDTRGVQGCV